MNQDLIFSVSEFVALVNQTFEYAFNTVVITGELANFRVSKNKWVYFDLKDETASVKFFGTVFALPGPLEEGMLLEVRGNPRLHQLYGFSVNVQSIRPVGEGSIKKAANLLEAKLRAEGLFDESRKRSLPYPPSKIGLIASAESAAYADFIKIVNQRWRGIEIQLINVQVQGELAVGQVVGAIEQFNLSVDRPEVLVIIRGGGSADDLQAFSTEQVTRAVAFSRIPTLVAIGHEIDVSLAELAADVRASTPSNSAEMLVPDRRNVRRQLQSLGGEIHKLVERRIAGSMELLAATVSVAGKIADNHLKSEFEKIDLKKRFATALDPEAPLKRGYVIVRNRNGIIAKSGRQLKPGDIVSMHFADAQASALIKQVKAIKFRNHDD